MRRLKDLMLRIVTGETRAERIARSDRAADAHAQAATARSRIDTLLSETKAQNERIRDQLQ